MYIIIWEYQAKAERVTEFERIYAANVEWADLFSKEEGYINTELLHDSNQPQRYITIDRWVSTQAYHSFRIKWQTEYNALDERCQHLTDSEAFLGTLSPIQSGG